MNSVEEALQRLKEITENYDEDLNRFFRCYMRVLHWTGVCVENEGIKRGIEKDLAIMREMYIKEHKGDEKYAGWIKTSERLPKPFERVLGVFEYADEMFVASGKYRDIDRSFVTDYEEEFWIKDVPYWMPLPEPPTEE